MHELDKVLENELHDSELAEWVQGKVNRVEYPYRSILRDYSREANLERL